MDVKMEDCLSARRADIEADVESRWPMESLNGLSSPIDASQESPLLLWRGIEPGCDMAPGNNERVAWRHWMGVPQAK
jgi:hypothetical protein